jgi:hypothetical protein
MPINEWLPYVTTALTVASGLFAFWKWADQRKRELDEQRFEQYWKLIEFAQGTPLIAKQKVALLLLKRYSEYQTETIEFLSDAKKRGGPWVDQNAAQIEDVLAHFTAKH